MRRICAILISVLFLALTATPASAQNDPLTGFLRSIFGQPGPTRAPQAPIPITPPEQPKRPSKPAEPKIVEAPKSPTAQIVLVIGDIQAQGLGFGLQMAFADEPSIAVVTKTRATAGLTRDGDGEWGKQAQKILAETKADFIVTTIGINDWQAISPPGGKPLEIGSEDWNRVYAERLDHWIAQLKATGKPFWWVGHPPTADTEFGPTRRAAFAAFLSSLNDMIRPRVQAAGGTFVDVWTAFTDEEGHYTQTGPDIDGQVKRLRAADGILFTRAGQRKLAFFVEADLRHLKRGELPAVPEEPKEEKPPAPRVEEPVIGGPPALPPAPWATVGPVIPLDGAPPGAETTLAGAPGAKAPTTLPGGYPVVATPAWRRLVEGLPIEAPSGRVDSFVRRTP